MPDANVPPELTPPSDENRAPDTYRLMDEDRPPDDVDLLADEKLPSDVKLVLWSFIFVVLLACSAFVVGHHDFRQAEADAASSARMEPATSAATATSLPRVSTAPPALAGAQATGVTPNLENPAPPAPPPAQAAASTVTPPTTIMATVPAVYPSVPTLVPEQIVSPPPKHNPPKVARRDIGSLCPIALVNKIRPGCNTFVHQEIPTR